MASDEIYMNRAIQLAYCGCIGSQPNPMVGAVIVCDDRIIGEGFHAKCGEGHAEVNAITSVKNEKLLSKSKIYVTLEPCSHYGKTPPCAELIIKKRIPKVIIGCVDPFSQVQGRGIAMLRDAGIKVVVGVLEKECQHLLRRFSTFHRLHRPYITLKWAQTKDGYIGYKDKLQGQMLLSNDCSLVRVHRQRAENMAIMVGTTTALQDNPSLTIRYWIGKNPLRIIIDRYGELPSIQNIFDGKAPTLIVGEIDNPSRKKTNYTFFKVDFTQNILPQLMTYLYEQQIQTLLVEGGRALLQSFIDVNLWDEAFVEYSDVVVNEDIEMVKAPDLC